MKKNYIFPAIFIYEDSGISIVFPDLNGCVSFGKNDEDALNNARECLSLHLYGMEQDNDEIPAATNLKDIELETNEAAVLVDIYMPTFRDKMNNKSVKKTLTIPAWLNTVAEQHSVNFSQVLQDALKRQLNV